MLESLFTKVAHVLSYYRCGIFKNIYITPQNQTTLLRKQVSKVTYGRQSHVCSLVFYETFFGVELSLFSQSPKVILWTNCAFLLMCSSDNNFVNGSFIKT